MLVEMGRLSLTDWAENLLWMLPQWQARMRARELHVSWLRRTPTSAAKEEPPGQDVERDGCPWSECMPSSSDLLDSQCTAAAWLRSAYELSNQTDAEHSMRMSAVAALEELRRGRAPRFSRSHHTAAEMAEMAEMAAQEVVSAEDVIALADARLEPAMACTAHCLTVPCAELNGANLEEECGGCIEPALCRPGAVAYSRVAATTARIEQARPAQPPQPPQRPQPPQPSQPPRPERRQITKLEIEGDGVTTIDYDPDVRYIWRIGCATRPLVTSNATHWFAPPYPMAVWREPPITELCCSPRRSEQLQGPAGQTGGCFRAVLDGRIQLPQHHFTIGQVAS